MRNRNHGRSWISAIATVSLLGLGWTGCAKHSGLPTAPASPGSLPNPVDTQRSSGASSATETDFCAPFTPFDAGNFTRSATIDNPWLPLVPGTQFVLEGQANRGGGLLPHRVVFTVTDVTKEIDGVRSVVVWDRDFNEGQLVEAELAFFAQDNDGNVWSVGEYPEEYQAGRFAGAPSTWIAGVAGAQAGTMMLADPQLGTGYYLQGSAPEISFLDCGKVFATGETTCVPVDCYQNVLVTDERSPLDHGGGHQRKFYAPGVGNVRIGAVGDPEGETLVLTGLFHLTSQGLSEARRQVFKLEKRAYQVSEVYQLTPPAQ